jgi:nitrogenase-stabilizing/protective protein
MDYSLEQFFKLKDTEEFFDFFNIEFDKDLVSVKRFHIMKEYGVLIKQGLQNIKDEKEKLEFLKFSLLRVYGKFQGGYAPSALDVWDMFKDGRAKGCLSCTPVAGNSCGC